MLLETSISFRNRLSLSLSLFPNLVRPSTSSFLPAFPIYFDLPFVVPPAAHSLILVTSPLPDPTSVLQRFGNFVFFIFLRHLTIPSCSCCTRRWCILFFLRVRDG